MYKVFLADDDVQSRGTIRESFPWNPVDFMLIGEASDGESAMAKIRDLRPDILLADEDMPFMDGLALCREVRRWFPWIQVILISKGDGLTDRREAEEAGVHEFLLRPVRMTELREVLFRAVGRMREGFNTLPDRMVEASRAVSDERRQFENRLSQWLEGGADMPEGWSLPGAYSRIVSIVPTSDETEWISGSVLRLIERAGVEGSGLMALQTPREFAMIVSGETPEQVEELAYRAADSAMQMVEHYTKSGIRVRIGACVREAGQLREAYQEMHRMKSTRMQTRHILGVGDPVRHNPGMRPELNVLSEYLLCAETSKFDEIFRHIRKNVHATPRMIAHAVRVLDEELGSGEVDDSEWQPRGKTQEQHDQLLRALQRRDSRLPDDATFPLMQIRSRIAMKFNDPGLSVYDVAQMAGVAPSRLCVVFEQEMGITVTEYIAHLRINRARELLTGTRMRLNAIAEYVGFQDPGYFCRIFERLTSFMPLEYRRLHMSMPRLDMRRT